MIKTLLSVARLLIAGAVTMSALSVPAQEAYPSRPVRIVVPYASGGTTDQIARMVGQKLSEQWGQTVFPDFKPGGGTVIGASAVVGAPADGYTLLLTVNTHVINEHLMKLPYHPIRDFTPLATLATTDYVLVVNSDMPVRTLQDFIAYVKARPGKVDFGTHGVGGLTHLAVSLFESQADIKLQLVPYKGSALPAMLTGEVQVEFDAMASLRPHIQSGKLRPLAVTGRQRIAALPDVPTFREAGLPDYDVTIWYALIGPANMPPAVVQKIREGVAAALATPDLRAKLAGAGLLPYASTPAQFESLMKSDSVRYGDIIRAGHIKLE